MSFWLLVSAGDLNFTTCLMLVSACWKSDHYSSNYRTSKIIIKLMTFQLKVNRKMV